MRTFMHRLILMKTCQMTVKVSQAQAGGSRAETVVVLTMKLIKADLWENTKAQVENISNLTGNPLSAVSWCYRWSEMEEELIDTDCKWLQDRLVAQRLKLVLITRRLHSLPGGRQLQSNSDRFGNMLQSIWVGLRWRMQRVSLQFNCSPISLTIYGGNSEFLFLVSGLWMLEGNVNFSQQIPIFPDLSQIYPS